MSRREVKAKQRRHLRWFREQWEPLGYTATYGASGHWKVRSPEGRYIATISSSPSDDKAPEREVTRILRRHHELTRSTS